MDPANPLGNAVRDLRTSHTEVALPTSERAADWRMGLVQRRRPLAAQITAVSKATDAAHVGGGGPEFENVRLSLGRLRGALTAHQADWPAVSCDPDHPAYLKPAASLRTASENLEFAANAYHRSVAARETTGDYKQ